jgi:hypothetical protein
MHITRVLRLALRSGIGEGNLSEEFSEGYWVRQKGVSIVPFT